MTAPRIVFVLSPYQNAFFPELADALAGALAAGGVDSVTTTEPGDHLAEDDDVFVLLPPHEYVALEGSDFVDDETVAARTIGVSAEQPHQTFFERNAAVGARLGAVLDFSPLAVDAYQRLGIEARHLPFGHVPAWDRYARDREIETPVLYLGNKRERRLGVLAGAADALSRHDARLLVSDNAEPNRASGPGFVAGEDKRRLLAATGLVVNVHQSDEPYFEWLRFLEAAHCGAPVLTEHSTGTEPFVDGEHFLSFAAGELAARLDDVLADDERLAEVAEAAITAVRSRPLAASIGTLVDVARGLLAAPAPASLPARTRSAPIGRERVDPTPAGSWPDGPLARVAQKLAPGRWEVVAPPGTVFRRDPGELVGAAAGAPLVHVMADGRTATGAPMLEGVWSWQPWRLRAGEHLGRVALVDRALHDDARAWIREPWTNDHPHLAVQVFAAVHGVAAAHVATPHARLDKVTVDPTHAVPVDVADRVRHLIDRGRT